MDKKRLLAVFLILLVGMASVPAFGVVRKTSKNYTILVAYFTATPKPLMPGQVRGDAKKVFAREGFDFALDTSTPVRFRRQMESISREYDYSLELTGSQVCEPGKETPFGILPDKKDTNRTQLTGVVTATYSTPNVLNLTLRNVTVYVSRPGEKAPIAIFKLDDRQPVVLGRTYVVGLAPSSKEKDAPIHMMAVSISAGG